MTTTRLKLDDGEIEGVVHGDVRCFYSIPYAAPLTSERRFLEPQPVERWDGVRNATVPGSCAPQSATPQLEEIDVAPIAGELRADGPDYLTLNVFAREDAAQAPVMVFIHGGSFVAGSKDIPIYDGQGLARDGAICVVINYRLGIEGFLPIPGVPTNLGLRDMIAALAWVRDNVAAFGGDPGNVTLFGESGGACCIATLMASPLAQPLFHRAICQSGHGFITRDDAVMQRVVRRLARRLRIPATREGFLSVPQDQLIAAQEWVMKPSLFFDMRNREGFDPAFGLTRFQPVHGDDVLPLPTRQAIEQGAGKEIDLLIGATSEEANAFLVPGGAIDKLKRWQVALALRKALPRAREALRAYGIYDKGAHIGEAFSRALGDLMFRWQIRRTAELHQGHVHVFEFDWRSPAFGGRLGAAHAVELPFVFNTLGIASGPRGFLGENPPQALSDSIRALWLQFARTGALPWPEYDVETRMVYSLTRGVAEPDPAMPAAEFLP